MYLSDVSLVLFTKRSKDPQCRLSSWVSYVDSFEIFLNFTFLDLGSCYFRLGLDSKMLAKILNVSTGRCWSSELYNPYPGVIDGVPSSNNYQGGFGSQLMAKVGNETSIYFVKLLIALQWWFWFLSSMHILMLSSQMEWMIIFMIDMWFGDRHVIMSSLFFWLKRSLLALASTLVK